MANPRVLTAAAGLVVAGLLAPAVGGSQARAAASDQTPAFQASAAADGLRFTRFAPGGPVSDQLIDVAGPTAQAALASLGTSTAYAALPDPGSLVNSAPGLGVGLLGQGAGGLPPIPLPAPPPIPLQVTTSLGGPESATFGVGPYVLNARSTATESAADAGGGLLLGAGPATELISRAAVLVNDDHSVTAQATSRSAAFSVGPLTIGSVLSTAVATLTPDGRITTTGSTEIIGASVAGVPVSFAGGKLMVNGQEAATPSGNLLEPLMQNGMRLTFQENTAADGTVVAPTFVLTVPFEDPAGKGTYTVAFGGSTVSMVGSAVPVVAPAAPGASAGATAGGLPAVDGAAATPLLPVTAPGAVPANPVAAAVPGAELASAPATLQGMFDIRIVYAALAALALAMVGVGQLARLRGAHR